MPEKQRHATITIEKARKKSVCLLFVALEEDEALVTLLDKLIFQFDVNFVVVEFKSSWFPSIFLVVIKLKLSSVNLGALSDVFAINNLLHLSKLSVVFIVRYGGDEVVKSGSGAEGVGVDRGAVKKFQFYFTL